MYSVLRALDLTLGAMGCLPWAACQKAAGLAAVRV